MVQLKDGSVVAFMNYGAGTCLDLTASNPESGTPVIGYNYNATKNQHWKLKRVAQQQGAWSNWHLINDQTGTALDLLHGGKENGTKITGWGFGPQSASNPHQLWRLVSANENSDVVMIQNVGTGTYVDLYNGSSENSTKVTGWAGAVETQNPHQLWKVKVIAA